MVKVTKVDKIVRLSEPSKELAARVLAEVDFKERFVGVNMHPMAGNTEVSIYRFEEAINLLHYNTGDLRIKGTGSIGYIDFNKLQKWIEEVYKDKELAKIINKKINDNYSYKDQVEAIKPVMEQRLRQSKEIVRVDMEN
ncbi:MAG: hypothetical protein PHQ86_04260 [Dehalococcoidales bacterium]|nr:hypothetical protein [Dehalococcoidales bacterium]